jgi:hypothetical protein
MAYAFLDGTNAAIDGSFGGSSIRNIAGVWSARIAREFFERTVFASGIWKQRQPGMMQLTGVFGKFATKSGVLSDPMALMTSTAPIAVVLTADTACTYSFSGHVGSDDQTLVAAANAYGAVAYESYGTVTTAWVVT